MPLPIPANVSVDIYRAGTAPPAAPAVAAVQCYLTPKGQSTLTTPYYTHVLYLPLGTDIRDNFQAGTLVAGAASDCVYIPSGGAGQQYTVVLVREWNIGGPIDHIEALIIKGAVAGGGGGARNNGVFVSGPAKLSQTVGTGPPVTVTTSFKWTTTVFDGNSFAGTVATDGKLVIPSAGIYLVTVDIEVNDGNISGTWDLFINKNGTAINTISGWLDTTVDALNNNGVMQFQILSSCSAGDYFTISNELFLASTPSGETWTGNFGICQVG